jgi:hypothetical protein
LVGLLRDTRLVDDSGRWIGGQAHLVQTGDVVDRGADSRKALELLMRLEAEASRSGGRVHALLGNHEIMNMYGDLRYVSPEEFAAFKTVESEDLRRRAFEHLTSRAQQRDVRFRQQWEAEHPLGWVEHQQAFGPDGRYGRWLRKHNTVVMINGILFVHGGISSKYRSLSLRDINDRVRDELAEPVLPRDGLTTDKDGPFWYRGLAAAPSPDLLAQVDEVLKAYQARHIVMGHTQVAPAILPRFDGKLIFIDVGLSPVYRGPRACLLEEGETLFAMHRGTKVPLPGQGGLRAYLETTAALDPAPSPLLTIIDDLAPVSGTSPKGMVPAAPRGSRNDEGSPAARLRWSGPLVPARSALSKSAASPA